MQPTALLPLLPAGLIPDQPAASPHAGAPGAGAFTSILRATVSRAHLAPALGPQAVPSTAVAPAAPATAVGVQANPTPASPTSPIAAAPATPLPTPMRAPSPALANAAVPPAAKLVAPVVAGASMAPPAVAAEEVATPMASTPAPAPVQTVAPVAVNSPVVILPQADSVGPDEASDATVLATSGEPGTEKPARQPTIAAAPAPDAVADAAQEMLAPVAMAEAVAASPALAAIMPLAVPTAPAPATRVAQAPTSSTEPTVAAVAAATKRGPVAPQLAVSDQPAQDEAVEDAPAVMTAAPAPTSGAGPAPAVAEVALTEAVVEATPSLHHELPASAQGRTAPTAEPVPAPAPAPTSFLPPLPATVAFAGTAEGVTARLFAERDGKGDRLTIELNPIELGSVEVQLRTDERGAASATFTVERPETLQLLLRDARTLVDLLAGAGFSLDAGGLTFELRQEHQDARQQPVPAAAYAARGGAAPDDRPAAGPAPTGRGLLDLRV